MLDAIIDSAGGDIMGQAGKTLKQGGRVVCYGMWASYSFVHSLMSIPNFLLFFSVTLYLDRATLTSRSDRTASPKITLTMRQVLANQQLLGAWISPSYFNLIHQTIPECGFFHVPSLTYDFAIHLNSIFHSFRKDSTLTRYISGSTMGSHQDLKDATDFIAKHRIVPIVSHVLDGLESADEGFDLIKRGDQFGKVVIKLRTSPMQAKL